MTLLREARFDPAVTSFTLNVDPLGSPIDPSSVTGDRMAFEYFVETADRSVRGYLNLASRDPAASERLERDWNYERQELVDAVRRGPQPEEGMRLVQRVTEDANAQFYTAEIQRFAARAQIAVGQDRDWIPLEKQETDRERSVLEGVPRSGESADLEALPPGEVRGDGRGVPGFGAIGELDRTHPLAQRPRGAGTAYDRALADFLDERRGQSQAELIVAGKGLRQAGLYGDGRLAAHPPLVISPDLDAARGFVADLADEAGIEAVFSKRADHPVVRCPSGSEPVVEFPADWEDRKRPGRVDYGKIRSTEDVQRTVHSVVWAARKSIYGGGLDGTRKQFDGTAIQYNRFCRSISHERLPGGRETAMRAINERRLDHVSALLTARATGQPPSYLLDEGGWQFPGRDVKQSMKVDLLVRNVA